MAKIKQQQEAIKLAAVNAGEAGGKREPLSLLQGTQTRGLPYPPWKSASTRLNQHKGPLGKSCGNILLQKLPKIPTYTCKKANEKLPFNWEGVIGCLPHDC